ncbi:amino acid ABC transporter permease [Marivita geojedonensis]|uniref:Amino acid ABC transporter permease n=1 Tax=Marivita geojedonensis TaxID=1123756 RepID=A0A1X4NHD5_9RHOB|nr:amino acid ABC transporter permease [Marivita geojedonensis]OSQ46773.1 amino acid ABC transporter permease [Marivita geojedonensis]PRY74297.1 amino acid ABC transporter membrane protein (PAAT family) [Marivita geojedonensis]
MTRTTKLWLALFGVLFVAGCSGTSGAWGWYVIDPSTAQGQSNIRFLVGGFWATILLSLIAAALSMMIGLLVALPGMSSNRWVRLPSRIYIEFIRSIPLLPMLFWVFYGLPVVMRSLGFPITIDAFWGAIITLAISDSAFTAEIYRAGIQSIPKGQTEAARTVGLTYSQTMRYVILPQAIRRILPPLANQFIYIVKMSAFASVIGMQELTRRANELVVTEYRPLEIYSLLILEYLVLVLIISFFVRWLERKMGSDESR